MSGAKTRAKTREQERRGPRSTAPARAGLLRSGRNLYAALSALLVAGTVALYSPVFGHGFVVYDDRGYVTSNPHLREGLDWTTIKWAFTTTQEGHWHPLTWLSHALDYQLFALNPAGHHWDSVLIHAINAVLLFLLLAWATKRVGPSLLVAGLFAVHPINVESVAWVAERKNLLSTFFFLLAIAAYGRYAQKPDWRRNAPVAALFAAALLAKASVITLPFALLLLDYWPLNRMPGSPPSAIGAQQFPFRRLVLEKVPLLLLSAASAVSTIAAQRSGIAVYGLHPFPLVVRLENAVVSYGLYLWKTVWPARLTALYPYPVNLFPPWQVIWSVLVLAGVTLLVAVLRRKRYLTVGWLWFLGTLIPVIGVVQIAGDAARTDRYAYIPLIGIFVMIAWAADELAERYKIPTGWRVAPALCVLLALSVVAHRQMSYWASEYDLWAHALAIDDQNLFAHHFLADALMSPDSSMTQKDLEKFDTAQQRIDEARRHFEAALGIYREVARLNPRAYLEHMATTLDNLGAVELQQNRLEEAVRHFEEALQIQHQMVRENVPANPSYLAMTLNELGGVELQQKRLDDARTHFEEALQVQSRLARQNLPNVQVNPVSLGTTLSNLGAVELQQNRLEEARRHFDAAVRVYRPLAQQDPGMHLANLAMALKNLATAEKKLNRIEDARVHYQEALIIAQRLAGGDSRFDSERSEIDEDLRELNERMAPYR